MFSFDITTTSAQEDGITFLFASKSSSISSASGYLGLPRGEMGSEEEAYFAIEFDTKLNPELGDMDDNHIGIDIDTVMAVSAEVSAIDLKSGKRIFSWVEYNSKKKMLRVWASYTSLKPSNPIISTRIDLSEKFLKDSMSFGFSASNGPKGSARHVVHHVQFSASTGDCQNQAGKTSQARMVGLGLSGVTFLLVLLGVTAYCIGRRYMKLFEGRWNGREQLKGKQFKFDDLSAFTDGFQPKRIIFTGLSAFGYEGHTSSGDHLAIKRVRNKNRFVPFQEKTGEMIGSLRHPNLVQFVGWCCEKNELILVYEYVTGVCLDKILYWKPYVSNLQLNWDERVKILIGVASALSYLHGREDSVIPGDVTSSNIMIDHNHTAKVGNFGFSRFYERSTLTWAETKPYLAPEFDRLGEATEKSDVYGFGVLVLEVVTGICPVVENLVDKVMALCRGGATEGTPRAKARGPF